MSLTNTANFQKAVLNWFHKHGRKNLPWQQNPSSYRVWVSEIMLQQTQVNTVIPYYERFMQYFPDVKTLAQANLDDVLHLWSGLGYYARARNLYKTAQIIHKDFSDQFPTNVAALADLPGIGLSTAGAILSLSQEQHAVILDGNVKRVLARLCMIDEWTGKPHIVQKLWKIATDLTPKKNVKSYNQAMMDLGAMICKRGQALCEQCPLTEFCLAYQNNAVTQYPIPKPRRELPQRETFILLLRNHNNDILLQKRPPVGIWGGLWSLPECSDPKTLSKWCEKNLACTIDNINLLPEINHTFSHFHLKMTPIQAQLKKSTVRVMDNDQQIWYNITKIQRLGLPAPIHRLLDLL